MPRRYRPEPRVVAPDPRYNSELLAKFINNVMLSGKKSTARRVIYDALEVVADRTGKAPMDVFEQAMNNVAPTVEVKPRRVGGATYQVPVEVNGARRTSLAMRWLLSAARGRNGKTFSDKLAAELLDAANNTGTAVKRREDTHRMADANKAFAHFRW